MGFPDWTLWGMGLSLIGALLALLLALLGQAPGFLKRAGISGARLQQHVRAYTGYALALVLLAFGFFVAGVPIGERMVEQSPAPEFADIASDQTPSATTSLELELSQEERSITSTPTRATPETGAFSGPPLTGSPSSTSAANSGTVSAGAGEDAENLTPSTPAIDEASPTPRPPTNTPSPTATSTASPTLTPTPIISETAVVDTGGSIIWLLRSPGGQNLVTVTDQEIVILLPQHANEGGLLWRQVLTVNGITDWVQDRFLNYDA